MNLLKVTKALADAEMTIKLNPSWEKVLTFSAHAAADFSDACSLDGHNFKSKGHNRRIDPTRW